jgi:hypothetical protein
LAAKSDACPLKPARMRHPARNFRPENSIDRITAQSSSRSRGSGTYRLNHSVAFWVVEFQAETPEGRVRAAFQVTTYLRWESNIADCALGGNRNRRIFTERFSRPEGVPPSLDRQSLSPPYSHRNPMNAPLAGGRAAVNLFFLAAPSDKAYLTAQGCETGFGKSSARGTIEREPEHERIQFRSPPVPNPRG